eukprot:349539_1
MAIVNGWFSEAEVLWPGQRLSLEVKEELYHKRSSYQDILIFVSKTYGKVLVLDGAIQLTERDECAYQEMMVHVPMLSHENPKRVLIIGGGDGGVLREICRHKEVEQIDMCEIDDKVCELVQQYEFSTAVSYSDSRLNLVHEDGAKFVRRQGSGLYDVIIVDSSDPVGPAESLCKPEFYESMKEALSPGGIIACQCESIWLHLPFIVTVVRACEDIFESVNYCQTNVPTYPSGQIGVMLGSNTCREFSAPLREPSESLLAQLQYYTPEIHSASFVLPRFARDKLARTHIHEE